MKVRLAELILTRKSTSMLQYIPTYVPKKWFPTQKQQYCNSTVTEILHFESGCIAIDLVYKSLPSTFTTVGRLFQDYLIECAMIESLQERQIQKHLGKVSQILGSYEFPGQIITLMCMSHLPQCRKLSP